MKAFTCPFCGSLRLVLEFIDSRVHAQIFYVRCALCHTAGPKAHTGLHAVGLWNARQATNASADVEDIGGFLQQTKKEK